MNFSNSKNYKNHIRDVINGLEKKLDINFHYKSFAQPVCRYLNQCLNDSLSNKNVVSQKLSQITDLLKWKVNQNYRNIYSNHFFENESFVEIIGPNGLLLTQGIRVGFLFLGEQVFYPSHKHEALELYNIISGNSFWQINDKEFFEKKPGDKVFHDIWEPHAMRTAGQPVLSLFSWSGVIDKEAIPIK